MKLLSLTALGLVCAMIGRYIAYRLGKRVRILEKVELMFGVIESEIKFLNRPTIDLIRVLSEKEELCDLDFLPKCLSLVQSGEDISEAWACAVSKSENTTGEDACILYSFGESLGKSDSDGQIASCRYHEQLVRDRLSEAREIRKRYASLVCGLGMLCGIGVFIILF